MEMVQVVQQNKTKKTPIETTYQSNQIRNLENNQKIFFFFFC